MKRVLVLLRPWNLSVLVNLCLVAALSLSPVVHHQFGAAAAASWIAAAGFGYALWRFLFERRSRPVVRTIVSEGPERVRALQELGVKFDFRHEDPSPDATDAPPKSFVIEGTGLDLGKEGGHSKRRIVHAGDELLSPVATRALIRRSLAAPESSAPARVLPTDLTERETEILALVGRGRSNDEIAAALFISPATAKTHINRAMTKLDAHDRAQLVIVAYESGLIAPGAE